MESLEHIFEKRLTHMIEGFLSFSIFDIDLYVVGRTENKTSSILDLFDHEAYNSEGYDPSGSPFSTI